jgi:serine/threonine protein kinase
MDSQPINLRIGQYVLKDKLGKGAVGTVYRAVREDNIPEERAFKLIPKSCLRANWSNEISKVVKLRLTPGVVRYHEHGDTHWNDNDYVWISWDFIPGESLRKLLESGAVSIPLVCTIIERVLEVLHACRQVDVQHGDLHSGNIMIQNPDVLRLDANQRTVWVTDFGYCTASMGKEMLDV